MQEIGIQDSCSEREECRWRGRRESFGYYLFPSPFAVAEFKEVEEKLKIDDSTSRNRQRKKRRNKIRIFSKLRLLGTSLLTSSSYFLFPRPRNWDLSHTDERRRKKMRERRVKEEKTENEEKMFEEMWWSEKEEFQALRFGVFLLLLLLLLSLGVEITTTSFFTRNQSLTDEREGLCLSSLPLTLGDVQRRENDENSRVVAGEKTWDGGGTATMWERERDERDVREKDKKCEMGEIARGNSRRERLY